MSTASDIVKQLLSDIGTTLNTGNGYNTSPVVKHGRYTYDQVENEMPVICVSETGLSPEELFGNAGTCWVNVLIYGYARHDGYNDNSTIIDLALDAFRFIVEDFTHTNDITITSDIDLIPGGTDMPVSLFTLELKIKFDWTNSNINK